MARLLAKQALNRRVGSAIATRTAFSHRRFSTDEGDERLSWGSSSKAAISNNLKTALKSRQLDDAWVSFTDFTRLYGFPNESAIFHRLIEELSYSSEPRWLNRAHTLVSLASKKNPRLLTREVLAKLCLSLARSESEQRAAEILRLMIKRSMSPPMNVVRLIVLHFVKTKPGTCLAASFLSRWIEPMRPDAKIFNLVLGGCVRFGLGFRGERVMESMARAGVVADANSVVVVARIHEMNGQRDELKKYKPCIDRVRTRLACHYAPFYDCLLSLHFKFDDFESVSELVQEICVDGDSLSFEVEEKFLVPIGSENLRDGLRLAVRPGEIEKDIVLDMGYSKQELIGFRKGKLVITDAALAKLVELFKRVGKVKEFSKLLIGFQRESRSSRGSSLCNDVIYACVRLGWVDFAHDMLDDLEAFGSPASRSSYSLLLSMYFKRKMLREAKVLVTQMRKNCDELSNFPDKLVIVDYLSDMNIEAASSKDKSLDLAKAFTRREDRETVLPPKVYELNSSVRFFCKAKMMEEAITTYRRMQKQGMKPTKETFMSLVSGFFSLEMFREITFLWGDIKRNIESGNNVADGDLFEHLAVSFLRGGYFQRVMEVIEYMNERRMFVDKSMYRDEFLKLHKDLYRNLKASKAKTEAQKDRLRYVLAFRKWAGIEFPRKPYMRRDAQDDCIEFFTGGGENCSAGENLHRGAWALRSSKTVGALWD